MKNKSNEPEQAYCFCFGFFEISEFIGGGDRN
jgi:hypothetical protein